MTNEKFYISSALLPCICVAMYNSPLDSGEFEDRANEINRQDGDIYTYCVVSQDDWKKDLVAHANDYLQEHIIDVLRNYGVISIEGTGIWSPKYYNFHTDQLEMTVTMAENWRSMMAEHIATWRGRQDVEKYICDHWYSYSGFISFMPQNLDEILTEEDGDRQLASYLTLALLTEDALDNTDEGSRSLWTLSEIMDEQFCDYENINMIAEYLDDTEADRLIRLWKDDTNWNELYWSLSEKIGFPWLHDNDTKCLWGKKCVYQDFRAESDGERLLFWAVQHGHTVQDLYNMAA